MKDADITVRIKSIKFAFQISTFFYQHFYFLPKYLFFLTKWSNFDFEFWFELSNFDFEYRISSFDFYFRVQLSILSFKFQVRLRVSIFGPVRSWCTAPLGQFGAIVLVFRASSVLLYWPVGPVRSWLTGPSAIRPYQNFCTRNFAWHIKLFF